MSKQVARIHQSKKPVRRHYIREWAEARGLRQVDVVEQLGIEKSQVSRWFAGQLPNPKFQAMLAELFSIEPEALLRHPDQDWMARFFEGRAQEERERIKQAMELAWPKKTGTEN